MEVLQTHNAAEFLKQAEKFLMEHEAENNLILGQAMRLARGETAGTVAVTFYVVEDEGRALVAGMHNQPYRLVLPGGQGPLFVWRDPQPVSMAAWAGQTPRGVRVNMVYTPPELRRRGYASAAVSTLTKKLLDAGRKFVFLFTDLSNPTSNKIYQKMGY